MKSDLSGGLACERIQRVKKHSLCQWAQILTPAMCWGEPTGVWGAGDWTCCSIFWISRTACVEEALAGLNLLLCLRCLLKRCWLGDVCKPNCLSGSEPAFYVCLGGLMGKMMSGSRLTCKAHGSYLAFPLCYFVCLVGMLT